jgi:hypothetical protein
MISDELLGAASLLVAVLVYFAGQVFPDISRTVDKPMPKFSDDRGPLKAETTAVLRWRAVPLALGSLAVAIALLPPGIEVVTSSVTAAGGDWDYDPISACFLLVELFLIILAFAVIQRVVVLIGRLRIIDVPRTPGA